MALLNKKIQICKLLNSWKWVHKEKTIIIWWLWSKIHCLYLTTTRMKEITKYNLNNSSKFQWSINNPTTSTPPHSIMTTLTHPHHYITFILTSITMIYPHKTDTPTDLTQTSQQQTPYKSPYLQLLFQLQNHHLNKTAKQYQKIYLNHLYIEIRQQVRIRKILLTVLNNNKRQ